MPRVPPNRGSAWLTAGGILSLMAAALHLAVIAGGPDWYRFFGAGEAMARGAERGSPVPALVTLAIAAILAIWGLYAFSGAGRLRRLPLLRTALIAIAAIYLARGLILFPALAMNREGLSAFDIWSSWIVLAYGTIHALGIGLAWPNRKARPAPPIAEHVG